MIAWPIERDDYIEKKLTEAFHLKKALVIRTMQSDDSVVLRRLGQMTANYLEMILEDGMTLAVCMGPTTYEVINAVAPNFQAHVNVAFIMGNIPFSLQDGDSASLARHLAKKLGGKVFYLPSPMMANNPQEAVVLRKQKLINLTLNTSRKADILLLGIGNLDPKSSHYVQTDVISADQLKALEAEGTVGEIGGQFYEISGQLHPCTYNQRMIGLTMDEMKRIPNTIAVAMGVKKAEAILGALRTGVIKILSTDLETALAVLILESGSHS
jgi:DNA-binding transcriptional regulator LsrR (DeoR family)